MRIAASRPHRLQNAKDWISWLWGARPSRRRAVRERFSGKWRLDRSLLYRSQATAFAAIGDHAACNLGNGPRQRGFKFSKESINGRGSLYNYVRIERNGPTYLTRKYTLRFGSLLAIINTSRYRMSLHVFTVPNSAIQLQTRWSIFFPPAQVPTDEPC